MRRKRPSHVAEEMAVRHLDDDARGGKQQSAQATRGIPSSVPTSITLPVGDILDVLTPATENMVPAGKRAIPHQSGASDVAEVTAAPGAADDLVMPRASQRRLTRNQLNKDKIELGTVQMDDPLDMDKPQICVGPAFQAEVADFCAPSTSYGLGSAPVSIIHF